MLSDREFQFASSEEVLDRLMELDVEMQFLRSEMEGYESAGMKDDPNYFDMSEEFEAYRMEYFDLCGQDWVAEQEEIQNSGTSSGGTSGGPNQSLPQDDEVNQSLPQDDEVNQSLPQDDEDGGMCEEPNQSLPQDDEHGGMSEEPNQSTAEDEGNLTCDPRWWEDDYDAPAAGDGENVCLRPENPPVEPPTTGEIPQIAGTTVLTLARVKILSDGPGYLALRESPDRAAKELAKLEPNDPVLVIRKLNIPGWSLVVTEPVAGKEGREGIVGYVWDTFLSVSPPEPGAILHLIAEDEDSEKIVVHYYGHSTHLNDDEISFYANVLVYANERTDGREPGITDAMLWGLPNVEEGYLIWIPTKAFADTLKGRVSTYSASAIGVAWSSVVTVLEYTPPVVRYTVGFLAGLIHGVLECVWDAIVGIKDLIVLCLELLWEILKLFGLLVTDGPVDVAVKAYEKVAGIWELLSKEETWIELKDAIEGMLGNVWHKITHPNYTERGHFHGWLVGYIIAEVVMAIWTAGFATAGKWGGRLGKFAKFITKFKIFAAIFEHGESAASKARKIAQHLRFQRWRELELLSNIVNKEGRLIGHFERGRFLKILSGKKSRKLFGGPEIKLVADKTTTVVGSLKGTGSVAERGIDAAEKLTGITLVGENIGGVNILRSPEWGKIQKQFLHMLKAGDTDGYWRKVTEEFWEKVNKPWLEDAIRRRDPIRLVSDPSDPLEMFQKDKLGNFAMHNGKKVPSIFAREVELLKANGYTIGVDGIAIPPP